MIDAYELPGGHVGPEGITEDPDGVTFYVSSYHEGTIFRGRTDRALTEVWLRAGADGREHSLGMTVDGRGRLFVCGAETGHVFCYSTATGELLARRTVPSSPTLLNDTCIVGEHLYVTDSARPVLWRLDLADGLGEPAELIDLTRFGAAPEEVHYLNGIVPADDGACLVVAAQGTGLLWRVAADGTAAEPIDLKGVPVNGDGLLWVDDVLYVCDNTDEPDGSVRMWLTALRLAQDARSGELLGRWERPRAETPTTAALLDGRIFVVNSQFAREREEGGAQLPYTVSALTLPLNPTAGSTESRV